MKIKVNQGLKKALFFCLLKVLAILMLIVLTGLLFSPWGLAASNGVVCSLVALWSAPGVLFSLLDCLE